MTEFNQYFRSHLKSTIRPFIYILVAVLVITLLIGISQHQPIRHYDYNTGEWVYSQNYDSLLSVPVTFMCILIYVIPVIEFSFFKKRINLDCAYSLPISRRAMGATHYFTGMLMLLGAFTASYLINFAFLLRQGHGHYNFIPMIFHYLVCILFGFAMYSLMVFVFNQANTTGDGIWFMILYTFIFSLIATSFNEFTNNLIRNDTLLIPWGWIAHLTDCYQYYIELIVNKTSFWQNPENIGCFIFHIAVGIASAAGFFITFGKRRMEKTEEISDSFFGFRVLIPLYAICGMLVFSSVLGFWIAIELLAILGYTIYRRGFHYKKSDIATLCMLMIFLFV